MRIDKRMNDQLREIKLTVNFLSSAEGSVFIEVGNTRVLCTATLQNVLPPHLGPGQGGWVTAEYAMLPRATTRRTSRERSLRGGRTAEIRRLIGRSLRAVTDFKALGDRTVVVDCDVIQADGGTRTASITGGFVAFALASQEWLRLRLIKRFPLTDYLGAVSVGVVNREILLDLCQIEDNNASVDANVVMTGNDKFVEIQSTAEKHAFDMNDLGKMLEFAKNGIHRIIEIEKKTVGEM